MAIEIEPLKSYTHCWLHTINDDRYVGRIVKVRFMGNLLEMTIDPIIRIEKNKDDSGWRAISKQLGCSFKFEGCRIIKHHNEYRVELQSSLGDNIILSLDKIDEGIIENLIEDIISK